MTTKKPKIIGIVGGSGSGKTTVTKRIIDELTIDKVALIEQDYYYKDQKHQEPKDVIIIEGMFGLHSEKLRELMDIKIFVDTPSDLRILRRLLRDINERGRTVESVINQYLVSVRPMHEKYIKPTKQYADIIVPDGGYNDIAVDILITKIKSLLAK